MKRLFACILTLALLLGSMSLASALNYQPYRDNEATFETFEEALVNGPAYLTEAMGGTWVNSPCLAGYPEGTTYVYRSAAMWSSGSAGYRKNTTILVYVDQKFEAKDDALAYITDLGLTDIINECKGSVVLVTPIAPYTQGSNGMTGGFGIADQYAYYQLQTAMCNLGGSAEGGTTAEGAYFGGTTFRYLIGIDGGATFISNYIASNFDYVTRLAGLLLVGGHMDRIRDVAGIVPTYLVNCSERVLEKYKAANDVDARGYIGDVDYYFNQAQPLQIVYDEHVDEVDLGKIVPDVYYNMFIKAERIPVVQANLYTASTLYATGVNWNQAPYSLGPRNAFFGNRTADGLVIEAFTDLEKFADVKVTEEDFGFGTSVAGDYLMTWFEVMPEEVLDGTAAEHSIPLILGLHGGGDDPIQFLDEMGLLNVAGKERIGIIAPYHQNLFTIGMKVFPPLLDYILDKYPALDPGRVYVTGYSMGGGATLHAINGNAKYFAAAVPNAAAIKVAPDEVVDTDDLDLPILFTTATYDFCGFGTGFDLDSKNPYEPEHIHPVYQMRINDYLTLNGIPTVDQFDFDKYVMSGFKADTYVEKTINNEYRNYTWFFLNDAGVPMVGLNVTDFLPHGLYQEFGNIIWDFCKHYSRDTETGEVIYNPYAD